MDAISCLAAPPPPPFLSGGCAYTDAAIARALRFSMSDSSSSSSSSHLFAADFASSSSYAAPSPSRLFAADFASAPAPPVATCCDSVLVADSAARPPGKQAKRLLRPGRAGTKRRARRASKRAPTTYISADPANFRLMVQHVTGVQHADPGVLLPTASFDDASAVLQLVGDHALLPADVDAALHQHHQQQNQQQEEPCFPTLDSWSVMYESSELL